MNYRRQNPCNLLSGQEIELCQSPQKSPDGKTCCTSGQLKSPFPFECNHTLTLLSSFLFLYILSKYAFLGHSLVLCLTPNKFLRLHKVFLQCGLYTQWSLKCPYSWFWIQFQEPMILWIISKLKTKWREKKKNQLTSPKDKMAWLNLI